MASDAQSDAHPISDPVVASSIPAGSGSIISLRLVIVFFSVDDLKDVQKY